ncbi:hypothetical protein B0T20DRAFT_67210 [Sordaria brevicollis]|uniref:Uncharacterized protein n=1 Tax=Sordaria brevicollis TaxID=83679 RepID=A0AAE0U5N3_SORBR|nr:hypothetical protein B0T20DRAFT_67210 [Sordaria brevicollis]
MKFFSAALSAATIGSALASPILGSACGGHGAVPSGLNGIPSGAASPINAGDLVPSQVEALTSATTLTWATTISDSKTQYYTDIINGAAPTGVPSIPSIPSTGLDAGKIGSGATDGKAPAVIVKEVTTVVLNIDVLVKADLARITELVDCKTGVDVQLLLEAIISLSGHLNVLVTGIVPQLTALIRPSAGLLVGAELQIVLDLVADIEALLGEVQLCIKHLVANVSASVLIAVGAQLQIIHKLIVHNLVSVIVKFALSVVAGLKVNLDIVAAIHAKLNAIHSCAGGLSVFLGAALKIAL